MGANRDAAVDVYTPIHETRIITVVPEANPASDSDGTDGTGFTVLYLSLERQGAVTDYQWELLYWNGVIWEVVEDSSLLAVGDFDPTKDFQQHYAISGVFRYAFRLVSFTGGTGVRATLNKSVG